MPYRWKIHGSEARFRLSGERLKLNVPVTRTRFKTECATGGCEISFKRGAIL
jgi:hypothetical protein